MTTKAKIITVISFGLIAALSSFGGTTKSVSLAVVSPLQASNGEPVNIAERGSGRREQDAQSNVLSDGVFG